MKLRIRGNSVRLRLTKTEVNQLGEGQAVHERTHFLGGAVFNYILETSPNAASIEARYADACMTVTLPFAVAKGWAFSEDVALQFEQMISASDEGKLFILVEKDFACLKPRQHEHEDESDMFSNPNAAKGTCG